MRIESIELVRVDLDLLEPLETSQGTHGHRPLSFVRVTTDAASGIGECAALAEPIYTAEDADGAEAALRSSLIPRLVADGPEAPGAAAFFARLDAIPGHPMAKAAVEMALIDAELRAAGRSLADLVGAEHDTVEAGATIGITSPDEAARRARALVDAGFGRIKVKIAPGRDTAVLTAVRRAIGFTRMTVDANGAYRSDDPQHLGTLRSLDSFGLTAIEQPFAAEDLTAHVMLRRLIRTPIVLDESVATLEDLDRVMTMGAADAISIKPARLGGIVATLAICERARAGGIELTIGGLLESGVGRAVALAFGASAGFTLPGDLGPSNRYFARDLTTPHEMVEGSIAVPHGPGIGVVIDEAVFSELGSGNTLFKAS